jgi:hypothetical protein
MISIIEYVTPNRGVYPKKPIDPNALTRGKISVRSAMLSRALPSTPNLKNATGVNIDQMRKSQNVSPVTGTRMPATAYKLMGRKAPPGTAFANVPLRR